MTFNEMALNEMALNEMTLDEIIVGDTMYHQNFSLKLAQTSK